MKRLIALGVALALGGCGGAAKESSGGITTASGPRTPSPPSPATPPPAPPRQ